MLLVMVLDMIGNLLHENLDARILFGYCILEDSGNGFMVDDKFWRFPIFGRNWKFWDN